MISWGNRSQLVCSNSLNIRSKTWQRSLRDQLIKEVTLECETYYFAFFVISSSFLLCLIYLMRFALDICAKSRETRS